MTSALGAPGVAITNLQHAYDDSVVLDDVNLGIEPGESLALLGPSGCGKTTLLRLIAGLDRPRIGSISIGDRPVASPTAWVPPEKRRVGMVFQDWALFPHLSIEANVAYGLRRSDRSGDRVRNALTLVGLDLPGERMPATLSGGQQQRVALARALAPEPDILLLDEPFSNLDSTMRVEVRSEVHRLISHLGITAVFVTHDQEEAFVLGDRVAVMRDGRIVQVGTPHDLYTSPFDRKVAEFIGSGTVIASDAHDGHAQTPCGRIPVSIAQGPVDVLLRPEQLAVTNGTGAIVDTYEYYGHDTMIFVRADDTIFRVRAGADAIVRRGQPVGLEFVGSQAVAFAR